jgi:hypothetical protein
VQGTCGNNGSIAMETPQPHYSENRESDSVCAVAVTGDQRSRLTGQGVMSLWQLPVNIVERFIEH